MIKAVWRHLQVRLGAFVTWNMPWQCPETHWGTGGNDKALKHRGNPLEELNWMLVGRRSRVARAEMCCPFVNECSLKSSTNISACNLNMAVIQTDRHRDNDLRYFIGMPLPLHRHCIDKALASRWSGFECALTMPALLSQSGLHEHSNFEPGTA